MGGTIYVLTFSNGKRYVGQTKLSLRVRWRRHRLNARKLMPQPVYLAWRMHAEPVMSVLARDVPAARLDAAEVAWIKRLETTKRSAGYNASKGGDYVCDRTGSVSPTRGAAYGARQRGEKTYVSARPCPQGHVGLRLAAQSSCYYCAVEANRNALARKQAWRAAQWDDEKARTRARYAENVEAERAKAAAYREKHREQNRIYHRAYQRKWVARRNRRGIGLLIRYAVHMDRPARV